MARGKKFTDTLLNLDMFGYPVSLYYHKNSSKKKSIFGLVISVILFGLMVVYITILGKRLKSVEHQTVLQQSYSVDLNKELPM